jgi:hypothetical protein
MHLNALFKILFTKKVMVLEEKFKIVAELNFILFLRRCLTKSINIKQLRRPYDCSIDLI